MGIADLWPIVTSGAEERLPFPVFVTRFLQQHSRPPRLAIDAFIFMFRSSLPNSENYDPKFDTWIIRNFMAKLWYLVTNNISFVVVFDGNFKPEKLRHGHIPEFPDSVSYDAMLHHFLKIHYSQYSERITLVETLKSILSRNRIDWVQAPAEAEAECAWLQKLAVVDYVVTDDSDAFVFGATAVLRSFNRVKFVNDKKEPVLSSSDYYVTPMHMSSITERTNLTRNHLVFIAVLRGGDYSTGSESVGIIRAKEIALCGTTMLLDSPRKKVQDFGSLPDFTKMFADTCMDPEKADKISPDPYYALKPDLERADSLFAFKSYLSDFLRHHANAIFGRATTLKKNVEIDDYYAMLYFFPLVNSRIFMFTPHSISYGEFDDLQPDMKAVNTDSRATRYNFIASPRKIGESTYKSGVHIFNSEISLRMGKVPIPKERKYNLKALALKFVKDRRYWDIIRLSKIKQFEGVDLAMLKFNRASLNDYVYYQQSDVISHDQEFDDCEPDEQEPTDSSETQEGELEDSKILTVTVPLESVRYVSEEYVDRFKQQASLRSSPSRKRGSPQKTTLDRFWPAISPAISPSKSSSVSSPKRLTTSSATPSFVASKSASFDFSAWTTKDSNLKRKEISPQSEKRVSRSKSPSRRSPRRRKDSKTELLPGQSTLTSFLSYQSARDPFNDIIEITSEGEQQNDSQVYKSMKKLILEAPSQLKLCAEKQAQPRSPEGSPTKRSRTNIQSARNSPPIRKKEGRDSY